MIKEEKSQYGKIILFFEKDIKSFLVLIKNSGDYSFKLSYNAKQYIDSAKKIVLEFYVDNEKKSFLIKILSQDEYYIKYEILSEIDVIFKGKYNSIDYKGSITVADINSDKVDEYRDFVEEINFRSKNNTGKKIRETILSGYEDPVILNFLGAINSKLDKILEIITPDIELPYSYQVKCISISGDGFMFYCDKDLDNKKLFATAVLDNSNFIVKFASICSLSKFDNNIWQATFENIDEEIRDEIVKFIFTKEREILKEARF